LALPPELPQKWVDQFVGGLLKLAKRYSVPLAGGDTAQSPAGILADIVVLGSAPVGKAVLRSGAKPGDLLYVTGTLGSSSAALNRLRDGEKLKPKSHPKHFYPEPRIAVGQFLREKKLVSAMIDISDGLSTDLGHICDESKVEPWFTPKAMGLLATGVAWSTNCYSPPWRWRCGHADCEIWRCMVLRRRQRGPHELLAKTFNPRRRRGNTIAWMQ
jgi:hypothetical protein